MIDHLSIYATDYETTRGFYRRVFAPLGHRLQMEFADPGDQRMCAFGPQGNPAFWVIEVTAAAPPRHVAFCAQSREQVRAFHQAGLDAGASDNGAPGLRPMYHEHYYAAFLIDPDGNNIEAVYHRPE
ncbi:VOC family protein [Seongchinamella unica]|uniref:VOC family protein n=1 Tax=Seongchinamella unica TaxID=2547392 RepID=A0A4V2ZX21_9GAMM|nr:VOC family protein [Seongchinamella unica]TDG12533.1 VOC family protein [Seongchinamella unica]